jgi:hypothetical protein
MEALQRAGVPAGVCQNAEDRCDFDPQLKFLEWMVELPQTEIGTWPVREFPVVFSKTPAYMGGTLGRSGPNYGRRQRLRARRDSSASVKKRSQALANADGVT